MVHVCLVSVGRVRCTMILLCGFINLKLGLSLMFKSIGAAARRTRVCIPVVVT
jgi:hypothetical protein